MISVTILTKNSRKYLASVLESLKSFDEVLLFDNGSKDDTLEIAKRFANVRIVEGEFKGFGPTHNIATEMAKNDWILSIDSDEVVTREMREEISQLKLDPECVYSFPRHNFYNGTFIKWCGWYPDRQYRLYHRRKTRFTDAQVHESIIVEGMRHVPLKGAIEHYSYDSTAEFLSKMQSYSDLFASQNMGKKSSSLSKAISHGLFAFFKSYFLKRGFMGGYEGFVISVYNGNTAFYKYLKLLETQRKADRTN